MKKLTIRYGKIKLNPSMRNLLRIICLLADFKINFQKDSEKFILLSNEKEISFPIFNNRNIIDLNDNEDLEQLIHSKDIYEIDILTIISKSYLENKENLIKYSWILFKIILNKFEVDNKFCTIEFNQFSSIIDDIVNYSKAYIKKEYVFKNKFIEELWKKEYGDLLKFRTTSDCVVNTVNKSETKEYKRLFEISKIGVESIDNAVKTLLEILPEDAETILDIGSGPGYVNRNIPPFYNILAMDIDKNILKDNIRECCIGDMLNIPLEDKSIEMSMACDVLEHIEKKYLQKAVLELERVSNKYIYIQVPFIEYLGESIAFCNKCSNKWHVNYHKNSFDYNKVMQLLSDEWKVKKVAFTGEVSEFGSLNKAGQILDIMNIEHCDVDNWKCPNCGEQTTQINQEYLITAEEISQMSIDNPVCKYSEIGVLFERRDKNGTSELSLENISDFDIKELNTIDLDFNNRNILRKSDNYIKNSYTPYYISNDFDIKFTDSGMCLEKKCESVNGSISFVLPVNLAPEGKEIEISVEVLDETKLIFCGIDLSGSEYKIFEKNYNCGKFKTIIQINKQIRSAYGFIKIYSNKSFKITNLKVANDEGIKYKRYISKNYNSHLCKRINNIDFLWIIPKEGYIDMPENLENWISQSVKKVNNGQIVFDYINIIYQRIFELEKLIKINEKQKVEQVQKNDKILECKNRLYEKALLTNEALKQVIEEKDYCISVLNEQLIMKNIKIEELESYINLYKEKISQINISNTQKGRYLIKNIFIKIIIKLIRILKRIAKIPFLYNFLVKIGVKEVYKKIKTKIKGENKYE